MILLAPYWLLAASAILIPIAIHLWNKRQGRTLKVGSLRWLEASASKQWSSIKLTDVGLLLLRCLILILLAVALAKPILEKYTVTEQGGKAIYISPELLYSKTVTSLKPTIDPLLLRGYSLYAFTPTFSEISQEQWQQLSTSPVDSVVESGNYWELLPALAQEHSQLKDSVYLFTSDQQRHFPGQPAALQENITWIPVALDTPTEWIQAAYATGTDSVHVIAGQSSREKTTYNQNRITKKASSAQIGSLRIRLLQQDNSLWVYQGDQMHQRVLVQQKPIQVVFVVGEEQQAEVKYLRHAFETISNYTSIPVSIAKAESANKSPDWLFWLSDKAIPDSVLQLVEQGMKLWLQTGTEPTVTEASLITPVNPIRLYQISSQESGSKYEQVLWSADNGKPLLTTQFLGKGSIYFFRSGFSPAWSRLGQSPQLPELLFPLLFPGNVSSKFDARALPEALLKPEKKVIRLIKEKKEQDLDLLPWLVLIAFILFLIERFITSRRVKT